MAVTIQQIAEQAGVSRGTVDRALNHRGRINPEVAERICRLADEMGYVQKERKHSRTAKDERLKIGVVTQLARSSFMQEVNRGIEKAAVELKEKGTTEIREIGLLPLRDLRSIRGSYLEVSSREFYEDTNTEDYVRIILTDEDDVVDGMQKLRTIYPNLMQLEYDNQRTREAKEITEAQVAEEKSELEYFEEFFELQNNHPMLQEQREFVSGLIGKLKENEL